MASTMSSNEIIAMENEYSAHNYHPLPVVFARAHGAIVWDPEGKMYIDMLSAYSAVNQGHTHQRLISALTTQASLLTLSSRAFHSAPLAILSKKLTSLLHYDMFLPMNTGAEAVESALKLARRWAHDKKGIKEGEALIFAAEGNFHGRTVGIVSMSSDPSARGGFGPFLPGVGASYTDAEQVKPIRYGVIEDLEQALSLHGPRTAAVLLEPIQGEAGIIVPPPAYLPAVRKLCTKHNVLLIIDEIQTGLGRTGTLLASTQDGIRADMILLGKALSGGMLPVSGVLADREVMLCIGPGEHGSTFGGSALGCAVACEAVDIILDEGLCERAQVLGDVFRDEVKKIGLNSVIKDVRGRGLLNAVEVQDGVDAWEVCLRMMRKGVLAKPTHGTIIRFAPPLVIEEEDLRRAVKILGEVLGEMQA